MTDRTVDLDALAADLKAADVPFLDHTYLGGNRRLECFGWVIWTGDETAIWFHNIPPHPSIWPALDIIRRHVAPPAEPPAVDVDAVMRLVEMYGNSRINQGWANARDNKDQALAMFDEAEQRKAAIRAALEGKP